MHGIACDQKISVYVFLAFISDVRRILHVGVLQKGGEGFSIPRHQQSRNPRYALDSRRKGKPLICSEGLGCTLRLGFSLVWLIQRQCLKTQKLNLKVDSDYSNTFQGLPKYILCVYIRYIHRCIGKYSRWPAMMNK